MRWGLTDGRGRPLQVCVRCEMQGITHVTNAAPRFLFAVGLRFYIASSLENAAAVRELATALKAEGHIHTYDWTAHGPVFKADATRETNVQKMDETAGAEAAGVASADVVIVMLPGGKGTHVELGMALAAKKLVFLVSARDPYDGGPARNGGRAFPCAFWFHPLVQQFVGCSNDDVVAAVRSLTISLRRPKPIMMEELLSMDPFNEAHR